MDFLNNFKVNNISDYFKIDEFVHFTGPTFHKIKKFQGLKIEKVCVNFL